MTEIIVYNNGKIIKVGDKNDDILFIVVKHIHKIDPNYYVITEVLC